MIHALVTRPAEDAAPLADALKTRGIAVLSEPLLTMKPKPDVTVDLSGVQALLFTSANGARAFASASPERELRALAVGDGTADALRSLGFARIDSANGDVHDLERLAKDKLDPAKGRLLHPAGTSVAGDLAGRLSVAGFRIERLALYDAEPAESLSEIARTEIAAGRVDWVLIFSPRTAETFAAVMTRAGLAEAASRMVLVALSDAVAKAANLPFARVVVAGAPNQEALLASIDALKAEGPPAPATRPAETPAAAAKGIPRGAWIAGLVAAAVIGGVATTLLLPGVTPRTPAPSMAVPSPQAVVPLQPAVDLAPLTQRVERVETALADLGRRLDAVSAEAKQSAALRLVQPPSPIGAAPPSVDLLPLESRLAALERGLSELPKPVSPETGVAPLDERLKTVERSTAELAARPLVSGLTDRLALVEQSVAELGKRPAVAPEVERRLAEAERLASVERRLQAAALAALRLGDAVRSGRPYAAELTLVAGVPEAAAEIKVLESRAATGIATRATLAERFAVLAPGAARAAEPPADLWDQALARLKGLVSIRRLAPGDDVDGRLARAELALASGDLAAAVAALDGLPAPVAQALASWRADAEARLAAEQALDRLNLALAASLGNPATAKP
jgi:uroporphyrinogen-III synthase